MKKIMALILYVAILFGIAPAMVGQATDIAGIVLSTSTSNITIGGSETIEMTKNYTGETGFAMTSQIVSCVIGDVAADTTTISLSGIQAGTTTITLYSVSNPVISTTLEVTVSGTINLNQASMSVDVNGTGTVVLNKTFSGETAYTLGDSTSPVVECKIMDTFADSTNVQLTGILEGTDTITFYSVEDPSISTTLSMTVTEAAPITSVKYRTHIQNIGWQDYVAEGGMSGTSGLSLRLEAINIRIENNSNLGVEYSTHVQDYGWQGYVADGALSGTAGQSKRLEAIKIRLTGTDAGAYNIYYRVHVQDYGWLDWAKNGEAAGTEGLSKRLEAIEIAILKKTDTVTYSITKPFVSGYGSGSIVYKSFVQDVGWQGYVADGAMSGTQGQSKRLEGISIRLNGNMPSGSVAYSTLIQGSGWTTQVSNGQMSGNLSDTKKLEAIKIELTGDAANQYDIYYRVHSESFGWLDWAKNGEAAGTEEALEKQIEAIEIIATPKGTDPGLCSDHPFASLDDLGTVLYRTHVEDIGWLEYAFDGGISGTTGISKRLEAINIKLNSFLPSGSVVYSTHVQNYGWMTEVRDGVMSGTSGESKRLEAIKIHLTGDVANQYDIYYRVHAQNFGWMGWAKNGEAAGTAGFSYRLEAIQIRLVVKNGEAPGTTDNAFRQYINGWQTIGGNTYYYDNGIRVTGWQTIAGWKCYFNADGVKVSKAGIDVSKYQLGIDWSTVKATSTEFAMIRLGGRYYGSGATFTDPYYRANMQNALAAGVPVGVYFFSQAITVQEAVEEANYCLANIQGYNVTFPIAFDTEYVADNARANGLSAADRTSIAIAFCNTIRNAGYTPMVYSNKAYLLNNLDMSRLSGYKIWLAHYTNATNFPYDFKMWQYTSSGLVGGIGTRVDLDVWLD